VPWAVPPPAATQAETEGRWAARIQPRSLDDNPSWPPPAGAAARGD